MTLNLGSAYIQMSFSVCSLAPGWKSNNTSRSKQMKQYSAVLGNVNTNDCTEK